MNEYQLAGGPDWMRSDRFDVEARAGRDVPPETLRRMVQALLEQRFQLTVRHEPREMPLYTLVLARDDKRIGPALRPSPANCAAPNGPGETREERRTPNGGINTRRTCAPIAALASSLSNTLQAPVHDQTGLPGPWDYELSFTGETRRNASPSAVARDPGDAPALFTALQEQLGLRLDSRRGPVDVLVIESATEPTEN